VGAGPLDATVDATVDVGVEVDADGDVDVEGGADTDVRDWVAAGSVGCASRVGVTSEGAGIEDDEKLAGVGVGVGVGGGVGVFVGGVTRQVAAFVLVCVACAVGAAEGEVSGEETSVAGMVPAATEALAASGAPLVGVGFAPAEAGGVEVMHLVLDVACGAGACDRLGEALVLSCPASPSADVAPLVVGVLLLLLPPAACVPLPSGPALPRAGSL
jgi:hypothetical protein